MPIRTHYDNLHISPDADQQTIRQAYRRLSKQYHPDLSADPNAHHIMQLINQAYEVLSDPQKRAEHDRWIAAQKHATPPTVIHIKSQPNTHTTCPHTTAPTTPIHPKKQQETAWILFGLFLTLGILGWQIIELVQVKFNPRQATTNTYQNSQHTDITPTTSSRLPQSASSTYIRPLSAPNGNPWPQESGYIAGYPILYGQSNNRLYIDNVRNSSDVYAQLFADNQSEPLRHFFIKERNYLILDRLDAGTYTIRYRQLDAGEELSSEHITISGKAQEATIYLQRGQAPKN